MMLHYCDDSQSNGVCCCTLVINHQQVINDFSEKNRQENQIKQQKIWQLSQENVNHEQIYEFTYEKDNSV